VAVGQRVVGVVISVGGLRGLSEGGVLVVILPVRDSCTLEATRSASATDCLTVSKTRSAASLLGLLLQKRSRAKLYLCVTKRLYFIFFIFKVYSSHHLTYGVKEKHNTPVALPALRPQTTTHTPWRPPPPTSPARMPTPGLSIALSPSPSSGPSSPLAAGLSERGGWQGCARWRARG
jgi:hypothetical protein